MGSSINLDDVGRKLTHEQAQAHRDNVAYLLERNRVNFPGAQPVSFARHHLNELERQDYYMCEKTDGIRCLLYIHELVVENGSVIEAQYLIDRKNDYYYIPSGYLHLPKKGEIKNDQKQAGSKEPEAEPYDLQSYHIATILDGELVQEKIGNGETQLQYLMFDCLCLDGEKLFKRKYDNRLAKLQTRLYEPWKRFAKDWPDEAAVQPFQLKMKKMERSYAAEMMFRQVIPDLKHGNDGLILTCKDTPYKFGTDDHILKWKPPHENTIDFKLQIKSFPTAVDDDGEYEDWDAKPELELLVKGDRDGDMYFADLTLTDREWDSLKSLNRVIDHAIIECYRDAKTSNWRPKLEDSDKTPRFRDDKRDANHISTVNSVLESIEDAVSEADLIARAGSIRDAWKEREKQQGQEIEEGKRRFAEQQKLREQQAGQFRKSVSESKIEATKEEQDDGPGYSDD